MEQPLRPTASPAPSRPSFGSAVSLTKIIVTAIMLVVGILFLLPFVWMLSASFKTEADVFQYPIQWIPQTWNAIENYRTVWFGDPPFLLYYWNSIKVSVMTILLSVAASAMAAYAFSKIKFRGRDTLFVIVLLTFMIPGQALLVPQFIMYRSLGLFDTHIGLVLLESFSALGTFMLRQAFMSIHTDFIESAKIDGAGHARIFMQIALPLVQPFIATYAILRFIWTWNDYQAPLIFLRSPELFTVQLGINRFADATGEYYSLIMAGTCSAILPLLIVFLIAQKHVIGGIALGGVKG
ncbi:carbohydrate ABC transporter permease [Paenibacillus sp. Z6-24]